ncbi:hypothetical protein [Halodesulfovibrio aestuarii]|uniref:Uncharacterized protein n=1 Tax=Halodesulfovibrio aestuarii TaxID=126333 RepID=A0A8G2C7A5_9BACT|nr:hypothetical protein [Halodesulfovibrio aestuarii]SHI60006.1 hypothetical protein SAMN05660830_00422 [Halodesulfovibrio aestuarii]
MFDGLELCALKRPDLPTIKVNKKYMLWVKIGGEYQLKDVQVKAMRQTSRNAYEVDVFGYGFRKTVSTKKLRERV